MWAHATNVSRSNSAVLSVASLRRGASSSSLGSRRSAHRRQTDRTLRWQGYFTHTSFAEASLRGRFLTPKSSVSPLVVGSFAWTPSRFDEPDQSRAPRRAAGRRRPRARSMKLSVVGRARVSGPPTCARRCLRCPDVPTLAWPDASSRWIAPNEESHHVELGHHALAWHSCPMGRLVRGADGLTRVDTREPFASRALGSLLSRYTRLPRSRFVTTCVVRPLLHGHAFTWHRASPRESSPRRARPRKADCVHPEGRNAWSSLARRPLPAEAWEVTLSADSEMESLPCVAVSALCSRHLYNSYLVFKRRTLCATARMHGAGPGRIDLNGPTHRSSCLEDLVASLRAGPKPFSKRRRYSPNDRRERIAMGAPRFLEAREWW